MEIKKTYIGKINGVDAITCDFIPENMIVEEEQTILYPNDGYMLEKDGKQFDCVEIKESNDASNYKEIEIIEELK